MRALSEPEARQYSPLTLAFLGDSVYEIEVRYALTAQANCPVKQLHTEKIRYVCAAFQARAAEYLQSVYTEDERAYCEAKHNPAVRRPRTPTLRITARQRALKPCSAICSSSAIRRGSTSYFKQSGRNVSFS